MTAPADWDALLPVGRDPATGGYRRFAWTPTDAECREWFTAAATARGLDVETDRCGNLWAWWGDPDEGDAVVSGSHLDSVPDGGAYDGPLGVASALAAVDLLRAEGVRPTRPVGVVVFADEEGARFGLACAGSRLLTGAVDPAATLARRDDNGVTMAEAMRRAGLDPERVGPDPDRLRRLGVVVELHIEQGRNLADTDRPVGVGTQIWPHGRWRLEFRGRADHAGTTRLEDRRDPMLPLARTVLAAREAADRRGCVATIGRVKVVPNGTNAIPSRATAWLDARGSHETSVRAVVAEATSAADQVVEESWSPRATFDNELRRRVAALLGEAPQLPTGAGHDAGILAQAGLPTAMLFVRNPTGVSHSPAERADDADCEAGVAALADVLADLVADRPVRGRS